MCMQLYNHVYVCFYKNSVNTLSLLLLVRPHYIVVRLMSSCIEFDAITRVPFSTGNLPAIPVIGL